MVRAILDGRKTQTRRVVKPQPEGIRALHWGECQPLGGFGADIFLEDGSIIKCPYGMIKDQLWVRETYQPIYADGWDGGVNPDGSGDMVDFKTGYGYAPSYPATDGIVEFYDMNKDDISQRVWPSIHMPRWASRIQLEITGIRVERLQDISEADAIAEGVDSSLYEKTYRYGYSKIWESINGENSWDANPCVWVIEFKRIR